MRKISWLKALGWALVLSTGVAIPTEAQVVQPTYVRPSKGLSVPIFSNVTGSSTSAVYDMTAFSEGLLTLDYTHNGVPYRSTWTTAQFGRFIKVSTTVTPKNVGSQSTGYLEIRVQSADTSTGTFSTLNVPGDSTVYTGNGSYADIGAYTLVMTPNPLQSLSYTRPAKGPTQQILSRTINGAFSAFASPVFDFSDYAAVSINTTATSAACRYALNVVVYGKSSLSAPGKVLDVPNSSRTSPGASVYELNVATPYVYFEFNDEDRLTGSATCNWTVSITPLPYSIAPGTYGTTTVTYESGTIYGTPWFDFQITGQKRRLRVQNTGITNSIECSLEDKTVVPLPKILWTLKPSGVDGSGAQDGTGGVLELEGLAQTVYCHARAGTSEYTALIY